MRNGSGGMTHGRRWLAVLVVLVLGAAAFVYFGAYNVAADMPHTAPVRMLLETVRERSVAVRSRGITAPADLGSPQRIAAGAGLYGEMCVSCHLGPGVETTELRQGLDPQPPELAKLGVHDPVEAFWIIKHGVKFTAMPAWGKTHPDPLIWDMVAFVRKLPALSPGQYQRLVASAPGDHDAMMEQSGRPGR